MKGTLVFLAVFLSLILAACGGSNAPTTTINVVMTDFQFQPSQFIVPAGKEITVNATNNGAVVHNFVIMKLGTTAGDMFDDEDVPNVYWEVEVPSGGSTSTKFTAPTDPGEYQVVCKTPGHLASGMVAKLIVASAE
jgi:plastocyanin